MVLRQENGRLFVEDRRVQLAVHQVPRRGHGRGDEPQVFGRRQVRGRDRARRTRQGTDPAAPQFFLGFGHGAAGEDQRHLPRLVVRLGIHGLRRKFARRLQTRQHQIHLARGQRRQELVGGQGDDLQGLARFLRDGLRQIDFETGNGFARPLRQRRPFGIRAQRQHVRILLAAPREQGRRRHYRRNEPKLFHGPSSKNCR